MAGGVLDREQLETFATIVDEGSFERAAMVLNVSRGAVSQRIKALEDALATVLLVRERPVVPTERGELLLRHVRALRISEQATINEIRPQSQTGRLVPMAIAVNADSLATWFPKLLWPLLRHRKIAIEVIADDQSKTLNRLIRGEVMGCVSTEHKAVTGFVAKPLGTMEYRCYATPEFSARHFPEGLSVPAVLRAPAVVFNRKDTLHDEFLQSVFGFHVDGYARHYLPAPKALLQALREGVGYGLAPVMQVDSQKDCGKLIELSPRHPVLVALYWHHWEHEPPLSAGVTHQVVAEAVHLLQATVAQPDRSNAVNQPGS